MSQQEKIDRAKSIVDIGRNSKRLAKDFVRTYGQTPRKALEDYYYPKDVPETCSRCHDTGEIAAAINVPCPDCLPANDQ